MAADALLGGGHEVGGQEPRAQVELGVVHDGSACDAGLLYALVAFPALAGFDVAPVFVLVAHGAGEVFAVFSPAGTSQVRPAGSLVREFSP